MRLFRVSVALLLTFSVPSIALAQVPPPPTGPATQPQPQPQPDAQPQPQPSGELTEDQKIELAKEKYMQAEGLANQGRWVEAVPFYEEAYYLVPGKHGFAHKVGVAAWNAGDCDKANSYLKHFLQYGDPEKQGDKFDEAKQILGEISVSGCATPTTTTTTTTSTSSEPTDNDNPLDDSTTVVRQQEAKKARDAKKSEKRGLLIGGAVLTGFGAVGVVVGISGLAIASGSANKLTELSTNETNSGFPVGDYACRDDGVDCPYELENRMATGNTLAYVGLIGGGVLLGAGVAMLAVYMINKKKSGGGTTASGSKLNKVEITGLGPMLLPNGAGAVAGLRF